MRRILITLAITACAATSAFASDEKEEKAVVAVVRQWTGLFNQDTAKSALASCADEVTIVDDFPPYLWGGSGACDTWLKALVTSSEKEAVTDLSTVLLKPSHVMVTGDRAYVVAPLNFAFKLKGVATKDSGVLTAALQKGAAGWRVTAVSIAGQ